MGLIWVYKRLTHPPRVKDCAVTNLRFLTHGGQVRLPWWGAFVTISAYGKQYESGLNKLDRTTLCVSRGIDMEGLGLPRIYFLCPPEIIMTTLVVEVSR